MSAPKFDLLIRNVRVVRPHGNVVHEADIAVKDGRIAKVAPGHRRRAREGGVRRHGAGSPFPAWSMRTCTAASTRRWKKTRSARARPPRWAA